MRVQVRRRDSESKPDRDESRADDRVVVVAVDLGCILNRCGQ